MRISANLSDSEDEDGTCPGAPSKAVSDLWDGGGGARGAGRAGAEPAQGRSDSQESGRARKSPSNRRDLPPLIGDDLESSGVGIDRLSVSFVVEDYDPNPAHWDSHSERHKQSSPSPWLSYEDLHPISGVRIGTVIESHSRQIEILDGVDAWVGVQVIVADGVERSTYGRIEFNPSRVVDPRGFGLASLEETISSFVETVESASFLVVPMFGDELKSFKVKRLDVAKDFQSVRSASALVRGLAIYPRTHARKNFVHADPSLGGAQTLTVGSNAGMVRLYDKFVQTKGGVAPGTVRWEAEARNAWAKRYGDIVTMADLGKKSVLKLALNRWEWSGMGSEVVLYLDVREVAKRLGIKEWEASSFYGWIVDRGLSAGWTPSATTLAKYRSYQKRLGISFGVEAFLSNAVAVRLDWDSGTEVSRANEVG